MGFRPAELRAKDDALRRLVGQGLRAREIAERMSLSYRHVRKRLRALGLKAGLESHFEAAKRDLKILSLRKKGLWASEIAPLVGMQIRSVDKRFARLKSQGFTIPPTKGPRPNAQRKVTDEKLLAFVQLRLSVREIASRIGMARTNVYLRLRRLKKRGLWKRF
jgi:transposase